MPVVTDEPAQPNDQPASVDLTGGAAIPRRTVLRLLGLGAVGALSAGGLTAAYRFDVEPIAASLAGLTRPLRVAWLCDLHFGPFIHAGSIEAWVDATLALEPDLILLGGDLVDGRAPEDLSPLLTQLERLQAPLGVFAVWGNHEHDRFRDLTWFEGALASVGVTTLVDRGVQLREDLFLAGFDDRFLYQARIDDTLAGWSSASACLFAAHSPLVLPHVPESVGLTLCGHTHGGQVRLPGIGAIVTRSGLGRAFDAGWVRAPALGYVSRGLGVTHVPIRLNCPAELTIATLTPA